MKNSAILSLRHVCLNYGTFQALKEVNLEIRQGDRTAIMGPNGAGKSSLFDVISGHYQPACGDISLRGFNVTSASRQKRYQLGLVRSFQQSRLFAHMTVLENLQCAAFGKYAKGWQKYAFWCTMSRFHRVQEVAQDVLQQIGLESKAYEKAWTLSYAQQRQLELGMVLASGADILLLDEPTAGLSRAQADEFLPYLDWLLRGKTVLLIEHDLSIVCHLASQAIVLEQGQVLAHGLLGDLAKMPQVLAAYPAIAQVAHMPTGAFSQTEEPNPSC